MLQNSSPGVPESFQKELLIHNTIHFVQYLQYTMYTHTYFCTNWKQNVTYKATGHVRPRTIPSEMGSPSSIMNSSCCVLWAMTWLREPAPSFPFTWWVQGKEDMYTDGHVQEWTVKTPFIFTCLCLFRKLKIKWQNYMAHKYRMHFSRATFSF